MGKMTLQQMITQLAGGMAVSHTDFVITLAYFTSLARDRVRAYVEEQADPDDCKSIYFDYARHAADATAHGGVFWTVLSVPHQSRQQLPSVGYLHRFCH